MKKLLTILLLITLAGQFSGYFMLETQEISYMQAAEDKGEKSGEEKSDKDYVSLHSPDNTTFLKKNSFMLYSTDPGISPELDYSTPPPDFTVYI